ncbi:hypothetical protein JTB14_021581 [Gonioctena quinquepunctata]|nr:hypothetical protein JTB14_021581 [Gonioctena quinquepunctata]
MDSEGESVNSHTESEEDDVGCYFLQPSSTPYNIAEKIQEANIVLFSSNPSANNEKYFKVKFRDELISFEPDMTDEDVNSIESDQIDITSDNQSSLDYKTTINADLNIFDIEEVEELEEIIEELDGESDANCPVENEQTTYCDLHEKVEENKYEDESMSIISSKRSSAKKHVKQKRYINNHEVYCKDHCIDKLDFDLSMSIRKLEIHEKVALPPLQLIQRKCCDEVKQRKEISKLKEQTRKRLIEDYRNRKIQQNEEVFSQWLKEISKRRMEKQSTQKQKPKQCFSPNVICLPNRSTGKAKERPKTASEFVPKTPIKKPRRPHTTSSCVFIEVPQTLLQRGINIGDLIITNSKLFTKKLHILAVS